MGVPTKGASVEYSSHITSRDFPLSGGKDATPSARDPALHRGNKKKQAGKKLSRSRRLPGGAVKNHSQRSSRQHWHQQQPALGPALGIPSLHHGASLPFLRRSHSKMQQGISSQQDGFGAPTKSDFCPASPRSLMNSSLTNLVPQMPVSPSAGGCESSYGSANDQEEQVIRRGLEDLLARPPPSFDYMTHENHGSQDRDTQMHRERDASPASGSLPELFLSRAGRRNGSGSEATPARDERRGKPSRDEEQRRGSGTLAAGLTTKNTTRRTKPTRSQSGGHLRSGSSSGAAAVRGREKASSAGAGPSKHTRVARSFEGVDAALLEEAFAFAERSATEEEEAERHEGLAPREGRKPRRDGRGLGADSQLHRGEKGGRLRRTSSSGGEVVAGVGAGGRIEVEDWVRGLPGSSPQLSHRQLKHQQSAGSINQAPHHGSDRPGGAGREQQARAGRREKKLAVGLRKKEAREEAGTLRFDRRREAEGKKRAAATVELVERFEKGTGVSALRAELEESQAAMRRSAEAFQQVASQWHQQQQHLMLPPPAGDR